MNTYLEGVIEGLSKGLSYSKESLKEKARKLNDNALTKIKDFYYSAKTKDGILNKSSAVNGLKYVLDENKIKLNKRKIDSLASSLEVLNDPLKNRKPNYGELDDADISLVALLRQRMHNDRQYLNTKGFRKLQRILSSNNVIEHGERLKIYKILMDNVFVKKESEFAKKLNNVYFSLRKNLLNRLHAIEAKVGIAYGNAMRARSSIDKWGGFLNPLSEARDYDNRAVNSKKTKKSRKKQDKEGILSRIYSISPRKRILIGALALMLIPAINYFSKNGLTFSDNYIKQLSHKNKIMMSELSDKFELQAISKNSIQKGFFIHPLTYYEELRKRTGSGLSILDANGNILYQKINVQQWCTNIPKKIINSIIALEDKHFKEHPGINFVSSFRAFKDYMKNGETAPGGSTITSQLAKNMFYGPEKTITRKMKEIA